MKRILLVCMILNSFVSAQTNQGKLAYQYYQSGEYDKAITLYKELNKKSVYNAYFTTYLNCLLQIEDYKEAEKLVARIVKKFPKSLHYKVDYGFVQKKNNKVNKAKQNYQSAIDGLSKQSNLAISLGNAFMLRKEY